MDSFKETVAFWATVLGTLVGLFGVIQSQAWLSTVGAVVVAGSLAAIVYARRQRSIIRSAGIILGGRSIDSLNIANLRRHLNRSLVIQRVQNLAIIDGEDLTIAWQCSGYCRAEQETAIEFSIDAEANIPFEKLDCVAFDVRHDARRRHPIRPILVGPDGISKKISVPLRTPLSTQEPFCVTLRCHLYGCMKAGTDYYTATLSFEQETIPRYSATLRFKNGSPAWVRAYECDASGNTRLLRDLWSRHDGESRECVDHAENVPAETARVYVFSRPSITATSSHKAA